MTKNEEILSLINPSNKLNKQDFIPGLGDSVLRFFNPNIIDYNSKLEFYFLERDIIPLEFPSNFIDVTPIGDTLFYMDIGWIREISTLIHQSYIGKIKSVKDAIAQQLQSKFSQSVHLQIMRFTLDHFEKKLPTLKIKSAINETLENNYWL